MLGTSVGHVVIPVWQLPEKNLRPVSIRLIITAIYIPYFGIRSPVFPMGNGDRFQLPSGRILRFFHLPYIQASYTMVIYDYRTQALFSSTLFSTLHTGEDIFAKKEHISEAAHYLSEYCGSQLGNTAEYQ